MPVLEMPRAYMEEIKELKVSKRYESSIPENYEDRIVAATNLVAKWLVRLYIQKEKYPGKDKQPIMKDFCNKI